MLISTYLTGKKVPKRLGVVRPGVEQWVPGRGWLVVTPAEQVDEDEDKQDWHAELYRVFGRKPGEQKK